MTTKFIRRGILIALSVVAVGLLAGCGSQDSNINLDDVNLDEAIQTRDARITQLEEEARQKQAQLEMSQREAEAASRRAAQAQELANSGSSTNIVPSNLQGEMMPPNAKAGECYARVLVPPVYETTSEKMLVKEASSTISVIPAKYETVDEKILVREAGEKLVVVPGTFDTVSEKVLVTPAREYWKKGRGPIEKVDGSTGEIMCLVKEDAVYKTVTRTVVKTPATTRIEVIPAEYKTVKVRKVVTPAREVRNPVEAEYRTVTKNAMTDPSYMEWRPILCETNMNHSTILDIQKALKAKGFNPGPLDGVYGGQTQAAVKSFQESQKLPRGALTMGTLRALGLRY